MIKTHKILLVEDRAEEAALFIKRLKLEIPQLFFYWVKSLSFGKEILASKLYEFDMVITDVMGVTVGDFNKEVEDIKHHNVIVSSSVVTPMSQEFLFVDKAKLPQHVLRFYGVPGSFHA